MIAPLPSEYAELKRTVGLEPDPLLSVFEQYCARAAAATAAWEWSWKFVGWESVANRIFWLGDGAHGSVTARSLEWLAGELDFRGCDIDGGLAAWRDLVHSRLDRALVAYAGANPFTSAPAAIKIYLVLDRCDADLYARFVRPVSSSLPPHPPPAGVVLLCHTIAADGRTAARAYVLFDKADYERDDVRSYASAVAGPAAVEVAREYPRSGFGLKRDTTDMLGIGLRPTGQRVLDPEYVCSPVMIPLVNAALRHPQLQARLHHVSWVTIPFDDESLAFPRRMREMNVYVVLDDDAPGP